jgi:PPOX class probable F420-dependent enzyme
MAFDALANQQFMNLITQRKSGADVATPVWFAQDDNRLYVMTDRTAGKVKRIRNNPRVQVAQHRYTARSQPTSRRCSHQ